MIIYGTKGRLTDAKPEDLLRDACPNCKGNLRLCDLKKWFTLYFIPLFPYSHIESIYHCKECDSSYKESSKSALIGSAKSKEKIQKEAKKMFAMTLAACMTHMAKIDGHISDSELREIKKLSKKFKEYKADIEKVVDKVSKSKNDEYVYEMLRNAKQVLTTEGNMIIIAQVTKVLLADGKIDKAEEKLLKEYMLICGIPQDLYSSIIEGVKKAN